MYTSPTINTSDILARQQSTLQTNSQNIVRPTSSTPALSFLDKVSNFIDKAAPVVYKVQDVVNQVQTRVPGTNLYYNPQLQQQPVNNSSNNMKPVLLIGGAALLGFLIYKAVK